MRIRRPSGPVRGSAAGGASKAKKGKGAGFAKMVSKTGGAETTEQVVRNVRSALLEELMGVAQEIAEGKGDKKEQTKEFVSAVIRDRFKALKGKNAKDVTETVSDLINRDEGLAQKLHTQLSRLAKS